jgi:hypothetical protein
MKIRKVLQLKGFLLKTVETYEYIPDKNNPYGQKTFP